MAQICYFYPRSPCGERPPPYNLMIHHTQFLSTLSLRRATSIISKTDRRTTISIHALLAESDKEVEYEDENGVISIHALLAESDVLPLMVHPVSRKNFYPRSPCGERLPNTTRCRVTRSYFYPRSPCGERRLFSSVYLGYMKRFLSTLSLRRATSYIRRQYDRPQFLSTLSLRRAT